MSFEEKAKEVNCIILDVDGVLTDGKLLCAPDGAIWRNMNAKDGYALQAALRAGIRLAIITSGKEHGVLRKLADFGVTVIFENVWQKREQVLEYANSHSVDLERALFIGDDLPDYEAMLACGVRCCPADAVAEIAGICDFVSSYQGGEGCVREIFEQVLKAQGKWFNPKK